MDDNQRAMIAAPEVYAVPGGSSARRGQKCSPESRANVPKETVARIARLRVGWSRCTPP
jgi:hypothetical protein